MTFLIADTFTDILGRLTGDEQKTVKTTAFDLQEATTPNGNCSTLPARGHGIGYRSAPSNRRQSSWTM